MSDEQGQPFTIAFQDEHLIVVDKAPGVVVHPARGHREDTLAQLLAPLLDDEDGGDAERRGIVHRLDRDTSGLLVVARSDEVLRRLQTALARRLIAWRRRPRRCGRGCAPGWRFARRPGGSPIRATGSTRSTSPCAMPG